MIKYNLACAGGHEFESWFPAIAAYDDQVTRGLLTCPSCGSTEIVKQPMAPAVVGVRKAQSSIECAKPSAAGAAAFAEKLKALKQAIIENSENVGSRFADEARKIHSGDADERNIHGTSTAEEARDLAEDGIPFGVLPPAPDDLN